MREGEICRYRQALDRKRGPARWTIERLSCVCVCVCVVNDQGKAGYQQSRLKTDEVS